MAINSNVCVCGNCPGIGCVCGCQGAAAAPQAACQCGPACKCGANCSCGPNCGCKRR